MLACQICIVWKNDVRCVAAQVYVAEGGPEEWQLDGIVWKSSSS